MDCLSSRGTEVKVKEKLSGGMQDAAPATRMVYAFTCTIVQNKIHPQREICSLPQLPPRIEIQHWDYIGKNKTS